MIVDFKIKNYWSFKNDVFFTMEAEASKLKPQNVIEMDLPGNNQIRLLKIAMAFGANASGKTNLLRAFHGLVNYIVTKPQVGGKIWLYEPFLFDTKTKNQNTEFELNFIGPQNIKYSYHVIFNQTQIENEILNYYPNGKITNLFSRAANGEKNSNIHIGILGDSFGKREIKVFNNQLLLSKFGDDEPLEELTNVFLYFKKCDVINATNASHRISMRKQVDEMVYNDPDLKLRLNALIKFADTKMKGFKIFSINDESISENLKANLKERINTNPYAVFGLHSIYDENIDTGKEHSLPFTSESIGTQALYAIGGKILMTLKKGGTLIMDELDTSLHPYLTRMVLLMFQSQKLNPNNAQLIFTSHDMTLLDRELVRRDQVWIAEKDDFGVTELYSLQDFEGVREETPFDKWYLAGKFGGLPTMKSIDSMFDDDSSNK